MFETLTIPFAEPDQDDSGRGDTWARLEQEYKESVTDAATLGDLAQMLALARSGVSAFSYIADTCSYADIVGEIVTVKLDFFVWLSSMNLAYSLAADLGIISPPVALDSDRAFDVPFDNSDSADLPYIFSGSLAPEMPFIASDGSLISPDPVITVTDSRATLSEDATCVYRADGKAKGYLHTIEMQLTKTTGYKIGNLKNTIVVSWSDENGKTQTDTLELAIPPCVADLLAECPNGDVVGVIGCFGHDCSNKKPVYKVYYSDCDASVLLERWETE